MHRNKLSLPNLSVTEQKLSIDINKKPITWFLVIPFAIEFILLSMYYSGNEYLQLVIVPQISNNDYINREFGLLENFQNIILLASFIFACYYLTLKSPWRWMNLLICLGFIFLFLEEIDYGWHLRELIFDLPEDVKNGYFRNLHNSNDGQPRKLIQMMANLTLAILFIALPIIKTKSLLLLKIKLIPNTWFSWCALGLLVTTGIAYLLKWLSPDMPDLLNNNTGEFTELWYYYLAFLYIVHLRDKFILEPVEKESCS